MKGEAFDVLLGVFKLSKDSWQPCLVVLVTIFTLNLNTNITLCNHLTGLTLIWKDGQSSIQFCGGMNLDVKHLFFQHYWKIQMIVPEWYNRLVDYTRKYWFFYESLSKTNGSIVQWPNHSEKKHWAKFGYLSNLFSISPLKLFFGTKVESNSAVPLQFEDLALQKYLLSMCVHLLVKNLKLFNCMMMFDKSGTNILSLF